VNEEEIVLKIAARIPRPLRALRAQAMLEPMCRCMGIVERTCPACGGTGLLNGRALRHCPICCATALVPESVARFFECQMRRFRNGTSRRRGPDSQIHTTVAAERWGRAARVLYRVAPEHALEALL